MDLCREPGGDEALCVVVDYKSSQKQLDPVLMAHGLQLQLLTYLNVMRRWPNPRELFGVARLIPAGVFYVSLRGKYEREPTGPMPWPTPSRPASWPIATPADSTSRALRRLDARKDVTGGDQFNYRLTKERRGV